MLEEKENNKEPAYFIQSDINEELDYNPIIRLNETPVRKVRMKLIRRGYQIPDIHLINS